jgi:hemoglobin-like flavoprotein
LSGLIIVDIQKPLTGDSAGDFMTNEQINLVQASFEKIAPIADHAAALFYAKLFDLDPHLHRLFKGDMKEQGKKLMQVISTAVENLERIDEFVPHIKAMGARHSGYGVEEKDYETVGEALLWTLEKALSKDFTAETRAAWTTVYKLLADTMKQGSRKPAELKMFV